MEICSPNPIKIQELGLNFTFGMNSRMRKERNYQKKEEKLRDWENWKKSLMKAKGRKRGEQGKFHVFFSSLMLF